MSDRLPGQSHRLDLKTVLRNLRSPFYRNSLFLITDYLLMGAIGFFFWILVARFYSPVDVGYGSAAISAMSLLSMLSLIGFNYTLIRFLPEAKKPADMINTCLTFSGIIAIVLTVIFLAGLNIWSPALNFIRSNIIFSLAFIVFTLAYTFVNILHNIFMAGRRSDLVLIADTLQSILKIPLAVILVLFFHSFGIAAASGIAAAAVVFLGLFFFVSRSQKNYRPMPALKFNVLSNFWRYSTGSYVASLLSAAPNWIMPIMVVNVLDSEQNAYFYIVWTISSLLNAIPGAASGSLFVEGSHSEESLGVNIRKALKFTYLLLVPAVIVVVLFGSFFLSLFGAAYSLHGLALLRWMTISSLFGGIVSIYGSVLRINNKVNELYIIYAVQTVIVLAGSYLIMPETGTVGIGYMWLGAQAAVSVYVGLNLRKYVSGTI